MKLLSQNGRRFINGDEVRQIYTTENRDKSEVQLNAEITGGGNIPLGSYETMEHAEIVLKVIGICSVDSDSQSKITQIPTREDMKLTDNLFARMPKSDGMKKLFEQIISGGGAIPRRFG